MEHSVNSKRLAPRSRLLSGGNPQIAKADGNAPVQAYIAAMPDWKREIGERLDALIDRCVPNVRKAVKWNSPFYGVEGMGWFLGFHVFARYVKVTFFMGTRLKPVPPGGTSKDARWIDIHESDLDEGKLERWVKQAAALPGWSPSGPQKEAPRDRSANQGDWQKETLAQMRQLILDADPKAVEEVKWKGTPVWSHDGIICTGESYKKVVKLTFARGAYLDDPHCLFNSSLEGNTRRAIDIHEGETIDAKAFKALVRSAVALNAARNTTRKKKPPAT